MSLRNAMVASSPIARSSGQVPPHGPGRQSTGTATPSSPAEPHAVSNLVPDALERLRQSFGTAEASQSNAARASTVCISPAEALTVRNVSDEAELTLATQGVLQSVPDAGIIEVGRQEVTAEELSVRAHAAIIRYTAATSRDLNTLVEDTDASRGTGIALRDPSKLNAAGTLAVAMELVRGGARCDQVISHLGLTFSPDTYMLQATILREIGLPLARMGSPCNQILKQLGITTGGPAQAAFELDVVTELGVPLLKQEKQVDEITSGLGIFGGAAYYTFKQYASGRLTTDSTPEGTLGSALFTAVQGIELSKMHDALSSMPDATSMQKPQGAAAADSITRHPPVAGVGVDSSVEATSNAMKTCTSVSVDELSEHSSAAALDMVTLANGSSVSKAALVSVTMNLKLFFKRGDAIELYELHEKCLNPEHRMYGQTGEVAEAHALLSNGQMHADVRNIIMSSLHGSDFTWGLKNPLA